MANFTQAVVRKVENGYVVSVTTLELGERGLQPVETHRIASDDGSVIKFLGLKDESTPTIAV